MNTIEKVAAYVVNECKTRGYKFPGAIIAQAVLESGINGSGLSNGYNNFWGMKCGSSYKGKSVNMKTKEEYQPGVISSIRDNFRAYDTIEAGVKGYFDFISMQRYRNLINATSAYNYFELIKGDGWATSYSYVTNLKNVYDRYGLSKYDNGAVVVEEPKQEEPVNTNYDVHAIALRVIRGEFGNGHETRRKNLAKIGVTDYNSIRAEVNRILLGR